MITVNKWEAFSDSFEQRNTYVVGQAIIDTVKSRLAELDSLGVVLEVAALLESKRVLKPGGRLIVMSMTQYSMGLFQQIGLMYRYIKMYGNKPAGAIKLTPKGTQQYLDAAIFDDVQIEVLGDGVKALYAEAVKARR
ncbi:hypothetical protein [Salinivibrio sp. IB872]|jgi:hypothetical protein|uniref:hypothetical protein n=1 Tax=Salinivibrio sp. IB872 TaxID=1766123 RepID=UPI0009870DEC|nr:hypothetical protein [Salinivibrio sp. IB872]OOF27038.1 hypothetical protein BZJ18_08630 [Salinivibrio sp. IB872]